jgi:hypothetical protein
VDPDPVVFEVAVAGRDVVTFWAGLIGWML